MKRLFSTILIIVMIFSTLMFVSCSNNTDDESGKGRETDIYNGDNLNDEDIEILRSNISTDDSNIYLIRDDEYYSLDKRINEIEGEEYTSGTLTTMLGGRDMYDQWIVTDDGKVGYSTLGEVPIITIEKGDKIVYIAKRPYDNPISFNLTLTRVDYTYGLPIFYPHYNNDEYSQITVYNPETQAYHGGFNVEDFMVLDSDNNSVDDYYDLVKGDSYYVSFEADGEFQEFDLTVDSRFYYVDSDAYEEDTGRIIPDHEVEPKESDESEAEYVISGVPAGLYCVSVGTSGLGYGVIRIK